MEMAIPASDMMFEEMPNSVMGMKASRTETGMVTMGTMAEGMCHRKTRITRLTIRISRRSSCFRVSRERWISSERS